MASTSTPRTLSQSVASPGDLAVLAQLRASLDEEILSEVLRAHLSGVDELCEQLQAAGRRGDWREAAAVARQIVAKTAVLGFRAVTNAAKSFAAAADEKLEAHMLRNGAQMVVFEHERLRLAIALQHPDLLV